MVLNFECEKDCQWSMRLFDTKGVAMGVIDLSPIGNIIAVMPANIKLFDIDTALLLDKLRRTNEK
jgi:hypothetical protein